MQSSEFDAEAEYAAPAITRLGTLAELTLGGSTGGPDDGFGTAGDEASLA